VGIADPVATQVASAASDGAVVVADSNWLARPEVRRELGAGLLVLGIYGAYVIHRVRETLMLRKANDQLQAVDPVSMPFRNPSRWRMLRPAAVGPIAARLFCTQPIC